MKLELFHSIADAAGANARVRRYIDEHQLLDQLRYRNVYYPEVLKDLIAHGGTEQSTPALWDGEKLHVGADAVIAYFRANASAGSTR